MMRKKNRTEQQQKNTRDSCTYMKKPLNQFLTIGKLHKSIPITACLSFLGIFDYVFNECVAELSHQLYMYY